MIAICLNKEKITECESIIIIPEEAISELGYIVMHTTKDSAHTKHECIPWLRWRIFYTRMMDWSL